MGVGRAGGDGPYLYTSRNHLLYLLVRVKMYRPPECGIRGCVVACWTLGVTPYQTVDGFFYQVDHFGVNHAAH